MLHSARPERCQCPIRAGLHFYCGSFLSFDRRRKMCQCPIRAGLHFYSKLQTAFIGNKKSCQCPIRAGLHFYSQNEYHLECETDVSMPYTGGTSFLPQGTCLTTLSEKIMCQCPIRAGLHFYVRILDCGYSIQYSVSMPYTGGTSFLRRGDNPDRPKSNPVSMPYTGGTSFLLCGDLSMKTVFDCVNALYGRDFIST